MELGRRLVFNIDQDGGKSYDKYWYYVDYQKHETIRDIILDITTNLQRPCHFKFFLNDIEVLPWISSRVIAEDTDIVHMSYKGAVLEPMSVPSSQSNKSNAAKDALHDELANPYLKNIKINNNFKPNDFTPTHRDKYSNRSKIYTNESDRNSSLKKQLGTAIAETITGDADDKNIGQKTLSDRAETLKTRTSMLLRKAKHKSKSSDSDSSEEGEPNLKPKKMEIAVVCSTPKQGTVKRTRPSSSSSETSSEDNGNLTVKTKGKIMKKPAPSTTEDSDEREASPTLKLKTTQKEKSSSSSEEESEDETENKATNEMSSQVVA